MFFDVERMEEGFSYLKKAQRTRLITTYMAKLSGDENLFYTISNDIGLQKVSVNPHWRKILIKNYSVIRSWVQYNIFPDTITLGREHS